MARMLCSKPCWAKAVSLSKVIDFAQRRFYASEDRQHDRDGLGGRLSGEPRSEGHAGFALMENEHGPRALADDEVAFTPPAQLIGSGGVKRRITPAGQGVASQFPRYGGFRSLKRPGDGADRAAGRPHDGDLISFLVQQM